MCRRARRVDLRPHPRRLGRDHRHARKSGGAVALLNVFRERPRLRLLVYTQMLGQERELVVTVVNHGRRPAVILEAGIAIDPIAYRPADSVGGDLTSAGRSDSLNLAYSRRPSRRGRRFSGRSTSTSSNRRRPARSRSYRTPTGAMCGRRVRERRRHEERAPSGAGEPRH